MMGEKATPLERQAADALRRARRLPVGPDRNDLRQLGVSLLWLHRNGMEALERIRAPATAANSRKPFMMATSRAVRRQIMVRDAWLFG
jgi:hypothetical protein